jgi:hypothetical protein
MFVMSAQSLVRGSLAVAFVLTTSFSALAETTRGGYRDSIHSSSCAPAAKASTASYRDSLARLPDSSAPRINVANNGGGYRGAFSAPAQTSTRVVAHTGTLVCSG